MELELLPSLSRSFLPFLAWLLLTIKFSKQWPKSPREEFHLRTSHSTGERSHANDLEKYQGIRHRRSDSSGNGSAGAGPSADGSVGQSGFRAGISQSELGSAAARQLRFEQLDGRRSRFENARAFKHNPDDCNEFDLGHQSDDARGNRYDAGIANEHVF